MRLVALGLPVVAELLDDSAGAICSPPPSMKAVSRYASLDHQVVGATGANRFRNTPLWSVP